MKDLIGLSGIALGMLGGAIVYTLPEVGLGLFGVGMTMWLGAAVATGLSK